MLSKYPSPVVRFKLMKSSILRSLFSIFGALAVAQLARAADTVAYSPAATTLQGTEPYAYGPESIVITPPKLTAGTYSLTLTVTATSPSSVSSATALSFVTLGGTGVTKVSAGVYSVSFKYDPTGANGAENLTVTFSESVPLGSYAGSYVYSVVASGWPATDTAKNSVANGAAQVSETISAPAPAISIALPTSGQAFTLPTGETTVQVPYDIEGTTVSGSTLSAASASISGSPVSGFAPVFYGLGTASVTTNIGTAGSHATIGLAAGTYTLTATAANNLGGTATATSVTFTVAVPTPPTIAITSPASGQVFSASGASGTASVAVAISGKTASGTISSATAAMVQNGTSAAVVVFPATFSGVGTAAVSDTAAVNLAPGSYTISASATSSVGGTTAATPVTFTVLGAPSIAISSPTSGEVFTASAAGTAAVPYAIAGSTLSGSTFASGSAATAALTSSTGASTSGFAPSFTVGSGSTSIASRGTVNLAPGTYTLGASETNNQGESATAAAVTFTVVAAPTVAISAPASGATFQIANGGTTYGVAYTITGTAPSGTTFTAASAATATLTSSTGASTTGFAATFVVSSGGTSISATGTAKLGPGTYTLNATATDSKGGTGSATPVTFIVGAPPTTTTNSISTTFTGTAIPAGDYVWFSGVINLQGVGSAGTTVLLANSTISLTSGATAVSIAVPPAVINFESGATTSTTTFDTATNTWMTTVPANYTGDVFLSGVAYKATAAIAGGAKVTWTGTFSADTAGVTAEWLWGAAAYSSFSVTPGALGVKPVSDSMTSQYRNSNYAGSPENFLSYLISGGTGTGGTAYTGAYGTDVEFIVPDYLL